MLGRTPNTTCTQTRPTPPIRLAPGRTQMHSSGRPPPRLIRLDRPPTRRPAEKNAAGCMRAVGSTLMRSGRLRAGSSNAEDGASRVSIGSDGDGDGDGKHGGAGRGGSKNIACDNMRVS